MIDKWSSNEEGKKKKKNTFVFCHPHFLYVKGSLSDAFYET